MQQRSLFDQANLLRIELHERLAAFQLAEGLEIWAKLGDSFDVPQNFQEKLYALKKLKNQVDSLKDNDLGAWGNYYIRLGAQDFMRVLQAESKFIFPGLAGEIERRLPPGFSGYLVPGLHTAELFLETGRFEIALQQVFAHLTNTGEDALLRQVQSYILNEMGDGRAALGPLAYALFNNPLLCRERYLWGSDLIREWNSLREHEDLEKAWIELPFILWKKGVLPVSGGADSFFAYLMAEVFPENEPRGNPVLSEESFLRLLYLAETSRERDADWEKIVSIRRAMKTINASKFAEYMALI